MTKHTPGPWVAVGNTGDRSDYGRWLICNRRTPDEDADQWGIATVWDQSGGKMDGSEDAANARLIAAAPDLLAALQDAAAFMEAHFVANKRLDKQLTDERMADIRSALAKAGL